MRLLFEALATLILYAGFAVAALVVVLMAAGVYGFLSRAFQRIKRAR